MKNVLLLTLALLAPASLLAFEGKVRFKMSSPDQKQGQEMQYSIKGDKVRIEMAGQGVAGGMILDTAKREMITMMDEQKMYMVMAIPEMAETKGGKQEEVTLEKTGEKEQILGHTAEKYIATSQGQKTELWLAEGLGTFMSMNHGGGSPMGKRGKGAAAQSWERALAGKELFPLRVVGRDRNGKETFRMETVALEKQKLPDTLFTPPADYQKFDMGGMMKGMIPGFGR